jgi:alkanesulfonate monooxygenase SsuD/methylene tetrahydromethanopterin reductase-like flavin-dependent oxidoreductase (luciferase family)
LFKKIWKNQTVSFSSEGFVVEGYSTRHRLRSRVPLFFGVRGPTLLKLAGKIADGVIISGSKTYVRKAIRLVKDSVGKSPRPTRDFRIVIWAPTILIERQDDLNLVKRTVVFVLADTPSKVLEMADLNTDEVEKIKIAYQRRGIAKAAELVTEDLLEEAAIYGTSEEVCDGFRSFSKFGAHEVVFGPPYGVNPQRAMLKLAQTWSGSL